MEIAATRDLSKLNMEPTSSCGRLTARPAIKRPPPPVITHWDEVINMSQSAPDRFFFFPSLSVLFPSPPFLLSAASHNLSPLRGQQTLEAEDQGPLLTYHKHTNPLRPSFSFIRLHPALLSVQKEHIFHKWVKRVILKNIHGGERGVKLQGPPGGFFSKYLLPFMFKPNTSPLLISS